MLSYFINAFYVESCGKKPAKRYKCEIDFFRLFFPINLSISLKVYAMPFSLGKEKNKK